MDIPIIWKHDQSSQLVRSVILCSSWTYRDKGYVYAALMMLLGAWQRNISSTCFCWGVLNPEIRQWWRIPSIAILRHAGDRELESRIKGDSPARCFTTVSFPGLHRYMHSRNCFVIVRLDAQDDPCLKKPEKQKPVNLVLESFPRPPFYLILTWDKWWNSYTWQDSLHLAPAFSACTLAHCNMVATPRIYYYSGKSSILFCAMEQKEGEEAFLPLPPRTACFYGTVLGTGM